MRAKKNGTHLHFSNSEHQSKSHFLLDSSCRWRKEKRLIAKYVCTSAAIVKERVQKVPSTHLLLILCVVEQYLALVSLIPKKEGLPKYIPEPSKDVISFFQKRSYFGWDQNGSYFSTDMICLASSICLFREERIVARGIRWPRCRPQFRESSSAYQICHSGEARRRRKAW